MENADILEQAKRYTDDANETCYEELLALKTEIEGLRSRVERLETVTKEGAHDRSTINTTR